MRRVLVAILLTCALASARAQQPAPPADAPAQSPAAVQRAGRVALRGVVVDAGNGAALRRARVTLMSGRVTVGYVSTDEEGRFSASLPAATTFMVRIVKAGYATVLARVSLEQVRASD